MPNEPLDLLGDVSDMFRVLTAIVHEARESENPRLALNALRHVAPLADLVGRLRGELSDGTQVNIHMSQQFATLQNTLLDILEPHPELKAQVARALLSSGASGRVAG